MTSLIQPAEKISKWSRRRQCRHFLMMCEQSLIKFEAENAYTKMVRMNICIRSLAINCIERRQSAFIFGFLTFLLFLVCFRGSQNLSSIFDYVCLAIELIACIAFVALSMFNGMSDIDQYGVHYHHVKDFLIKYSQLIISLKITEDELEEDCWQLIRMKANDNLTNVAKELLVQEVALKSVRDRVRKNVHDSLKPDPSLDICIDQTSVIVQNIRSDLNDMYKLYSWFDLCTDKYVYFDRAHDLMKEATLVEINK